MRDQSPEEEAKYLVEQLHKKAVGRVCWQSRAEWEAAYEHIAAYYREKREFEAVLNAPRPVLRGRKASNRMPFL